MAAPTAAAEAEAEERARRRAGLLLTAIVVVLVLLHCLSLLARDPLPTDFLTTIDATAGTSAAALMPSFQ